MKKILIALIIIAIILGIIFGIRSCGTRKKIVDSEEEEYSAFINANIEFTCAFIKDRTLEIDKIESEKLVKESYKKYKLPVEDNEAMFTILKKYENNQEVAEIIKTNTQNCLKGGSPIFFQRLPE